jgi:hypothetical protein
MIGCGLFLMLAATLSSPARAEGLECLPATGVVIDLRAGWQVADASTVLHQGPNGPDAALQFEHLSGGGQVSCQQIGETAARNGKDVRIDDNRPSLDFDPYVVYMRFEGESERHWCADVGGGNLTVVLAWEDGAPAQVRDDAAVMAAEVARSMLALLRGQPQSCAEVLGSAEAPYVAPEAMRQAFVITYGGRGTLPLGVALPWTAEGVIRSAKLTSHGFPRISDAEVAAGFAQGGYLSYHLHWLPLGFGGWIMPAWGLGLSTGGALDGAGLKSASAPLPFQAQVPLEAQTWLDIGARLRLRAWGRVAKGLPDNGRREGALSLPWVDQLEAGLDTVVGWRSGWDKGLLLGIGYGEVLEARRLSVEVALAYAKGDD